MEEVQINTAAHSAEASTPGVQSQFISKSGGNEFRGTYFGGYSPETLAVAQHRRRSDRARAAGRRRHRGPRTSTACPRIRTTNIGFGGYAIKDRLWWYGSYRHQDVKARFVNFPVKPQTTILNNYSAKVTYNLSQNNKLIGYTQPSQKKQPQRFDSFLLGVDTGINTSEATTWNQNFWAWVHKAEWNGVLERQRVRRDARRPVRLRLDQRRQRHRAALRGHRQQPDFRPQPQLGARAAAQPGARDRRACSRTPGPASTTSSSAARSSTKPSTTSTSTATKRTSCTCMQNSAPLDIIFFQAPNVSQNGLWTYGALRQRHLARDDQADVEHRRAVRPLPRVPAGAGARGRPLQSDGRSPSPPKTTSSTSTCSRRGSASPTT